MKKRLILWLALLIAGFLIGFVPQFRSRMQLEAKLAEVDSRYQASLAGSRLYALRDSISLAYLEATRKNYGTAGEHAGRFFNQVRELAGQTDAPELNQAMQALLGSRNDVTAALANADASVVGLLQELLLKAFRATGALTG